MTCKISSFAYFSINWRCWHLLGFTALQKDSSNTNILNRRSLYIIWSIVANSLVTCLLPLHLGFGIPLSTEKSMFFESVAITITSVGASIKPVLFFLNIKTILRMKTILQTLDARVMRVDEKTYYRERLRHSVAQIQNTFLTIYASVGIVVALSFVLSRGQRLLYQGWLPFDWRYSLKNYGIAITYQLVGFCLQLLQNFTNDTFAPKALCVLSGHIQLLHIRVSKIGHDDEQNPDIGKISMREQEKELTRCLDDHKNLYELFTVIQKIISWPMFTQIFVSVANSCVAVVALLFYVTDIVGRIYYVFYIMGVALQLFPTCYYGSDVILLFDRLHYAAFSSNWMDQSKSFKRHMMIFTERSLRNAVAVAGGIFPIHLDTFFAACKAAYSLFALILTMK